MLLALAAGGCTHPRNMTHGERGIPDFRIDNAVAVYALPDRIVRVVALPVHQSGADEASKDRLETTLWSELGKTGRFQVVTLSRGDMDRHFGVREVSTVHPLPANFWEELATVYQADAILFTEVTHYRPYKPMALGVRARLVDLLTQKPLWVVDEVFDAGNPQVAVSAQRYQRNYTDNPYPLDTSASVLQSPTRFAKYVSYEIFSTLPPRQIDAIEALAPAELGDEKRVKISHERRRGKH